MEKLKLINVVRLEVRFVKKGKFISRALAREEHLLDVWLIKPNCVKRIMKNYKMTPQAFRKLVKQIRIVNLDILMLIAVLNLEYVCRNIRRVLICDLSMMRFMEMK